jgi:Fuc2NAc and GlcNAc transferase
MGLQSGVWLGAVLAAIAACALSGVIAWCGPVDRPRARGMHDAPTPTAGGLALFGGAAIALFAAAPTIRPSAIGEIGFAAAFAVAIAHGLLGALDDVFDFGAKAKLLVQLVLALAFAALVHPARIPLTNTLGVDLPWLAGVAGVALWMIVAVNAVNFTDGSNGLVVGALAIVLSGLGLRTLGEADSALPAVLLGAAGACLGLLPWNYPKARLFQGDAGALYLGALIAALAVVAAGPGRVAAPMNLFTVPIALTPLLTDVLLTLIVRWRRKARLFDAHKDHLYQRWMSAHGGDHGALARRFWLIIALYTLTATSVAQGDPLAGVTAFAIGVAVAAAGWLWIDRELRRSG